MKLGFSVLDKQLIKPPNYDIFDPPNASKDTKKTMARNITTPRKSLSHRNRPHSNTHSNTHQSPTTNALVDISGKYDSIISADPTHATRIGRPTLLNRFIIIWQ